MSTIFAFVYLLVFLLSLFIIFKVHKTFAAPPTIIAITFLIFPLFCAFSSLGLFAFSLETHLLILISYFSFFVGYLFSYKKQPFSKGSAKFNNNTNYNLILLLNGLAFILLIPKLWGSIEIIRTNGWVSLRNEYENVLGSTEQNIIYLWLVKSIPVASSYVICVDLFNTKNSKQILCLCITILNVLLDVFIFAARATLVRFIIVFVFAFIFTKNRKLSNKELIILSILSIISIFFIVYVTFQRNSESFSSFSFFDSVVLYYVAPFGLFNHYVANPGFSNLTVGGLQYGSVGFGFIYNLIRCGLYVIFGLPYNGSDAVITSVTSEMVKIGLNATMNAGSTAIYYFLRDFGVLSVIIGFVVIGALLNFLYRKYLSDKTTRSAAFLVFGLYIILRLSSSYDLNSPSFLFQILFVFLMTSRSKFALAKNVN